MQFLKAPQFTVKSFFPKHSANAFFASATRSVTAVIAFSMSKALIASITVITSFGRTLIASMHLVRLFEGSGTLSETDQCKSEQ